MKIWQKVFQGLIILVLVFGVLAPVVIASGAASPAASFTQPQATWQAASTPATGGVVAWITVKPDVQPYVAWNS